jgi:hypothetical protein
MNAFDLINSRLMWSALGLLLVSSSILVTLKHFLLFIETSFLSMSDEKDPEDNRLGTSNSNLILKETSNLKWA